MNECEKYFTSTLKRERANFQLGDYEEKICSD